MIKLKKLSFLLLSFLIVFGCAKEDNENTEPSINYPTIVGDWAIIQINKTVITNGTIDESQSHKAEYPGIMKFSETGNQTVDINGTITENTYIDKGESIVVKNQSGEQVYICRQRSQNQLVFDVTEKKNGSTYKSSYVLERTSLDEFSAIEGNWIVVRLERLTQQTGVDQTTTFNYAGTFEFKENGTAKIEVNHKTNDFTFTDRGFYLLIKNTTTKEEVRYSMRIRTATKLIFDAIITIGAQEVRETYILEKLQITTDPTDLIGGWHIVRYDYTELVNGVLNANKTVSLNSPGIIYFNTENKETLILNETTYHNTYFDYGTTLLFNDGVSKQNVIYYIRHRTANLLLLERSETIEGKTINQSFILEKHSLVGYWNINYFDQVVKINGILDNSQTVTRYNCGSINFSADGNETLTLNGTSYYNTYSDLGETLKFTDMNGDIWNYSYSVRNKNKISIKYSGAINGVERIQTYELTRY